MDTGTTTPIIANMDTLSFRISLRIRHPTYDMEVVTAELGLQPQIVWKAGDRRVTPTGEVLEGIYRHSYWVYRLDISKEQQVDEVVRTHLTTLEDHAVFFRKLIDDGGSAEYLVGCFLHANSGVCFDAEILERMGMLGIDLALDLYPP